MPSTFTFEEAQEEQPKTFSFEEALGEPAAPDLSKIKLSPYEQAIEANRGMRPESGMEPGTEFTSAVGESMIRDPLGTLFTPAVEIPRIEGKTTLGKIAAAPVNVASGLIQGVESLGGLLTLPLGGPLVKGVFGGLAAKSAGEQLGQASVTGDVQQAAEGVLGAGVAPFIALHGSLPVRVPGAPVSFETGRVLPPPAQRGVPTSIGTEATPGMAERAQNAMLDVGRRAGQVVQPVTERAEVVQPAPQAPEKPAAVVQVEPEVETKAEPTVEPTAKEPWKMTKAEWIENTKEKLEPENVKLRAMGFQGAVPNENAHYNQVKHAIDRGDPVPPEVLADYPDLKPTPPPEPKPTPEPKPGRDWELFNEQLQEELDSFNPARTTGRINYELNDVADRFVDFAKSDKTGKPLNELVKDFAETDDATPSQIKKLAQSVKSLTAQEKPEPKPAPAAVEGMVQTKPAETLAPTVAPAGETQSIPPRNLPQYGISSKDVARQYGLPEDFYGTADETGQVSSKYRTKEYDDAVEAEKRVQKLQGVNAITIRRQARQRTEKAFEDLVNKARSTEKPTPPPAGEKWKGVGIQKSNLPPSARLSEAEIARRNEEQRWLEQQPDYQKANADLKAVLSKIGNRLMGGVDTPAKRKMLDRLSKAEDKVADVVDRLLKDRTTPPPTAAAKVQAEVEKVAATEGQRPAKEVKAEYVQRVEDELDKIVSKQEWTATQNPEYPQRWELKAKDGNSIAVDVEKKDKGYTGTVFGVAGGKKSVKGKTVEDVLYDAKAHASSEGGSVTINIPGDGDVTVFRNGTALVELRDRAKRISTNEGGGKPGVLPTGSEPKLSEQAEAVSKAYGSAEAAYRSARHQLRELQSQEPPRSSEDRNEWNDKIQGANALIDELYRHTEAGKLDAQAEAARDRVGTYKQGAEGFETEITRLEKIKRKTQAHKDRLEDLKERYKQNQDFISTNTRNAEQWEQQAAKEKAALESEPTPAAPMAGPGETKLSLTPLQARYFDLKKSHPDEVVLIRLGDFYEAFGPDAEKLSKDAGVTLTMRNKVQMAGVPYHAANMYVGRLESMGHKVFIDEGAKSPEPSAPKPSATEGMAGPGSPSIVGMGGAIPTEFAPGGGRPSSNKNALVDRERAQRGLPPMEPVLRRDWGSVWEEAMARIDADPGWQDRLVAELVEKPRPITDVENAALLQRRVDLRNEYDKAARDAAQAYADGQHEMLDAAQVRRAMFSDKLVELEQATGRGGAGTFLGRGLNARRMMMNEDFTLAKLELDKRADNGFRPLTDAERANLEKIAADWQKTSQDLEAKLARREIELSTAQAQLELNRQKLEAAQEPRYAPRVIQIAENFAQRMDKKAEQALAKIRELIDKPGMMAGPINPELLDNLAIYGAAKLTRGAVDFAKWSDRMVRDIGEKIRPHLAAIWEKTQAIFNAEADALEQSAGPAGKAVRKKLSEMSRHEKIADITGKIGKMVKDGKGKDISPMVQKLARLFVTEGTTDLKTLVKQLYAAILPYASDLTERDVMDAFSGYGRFKLLSKGEIDVTLRDLRGQGQQIAKIEDMNNGKAPMRTGLQRRIPSDVERELIRVVNENKAKGNYTVTNPDTQLRSRLQQWKTTVEHRIADLEKKLAEKDYTLRKPVPELKMDPEAIRLQAHLERIRKSWYEARRADQLANRKAWQKVADRFVRWERAFKLSSPVVFGKLTSAALTRGVTTLAEEAVGGLQSLVPGISKVARQAPREGGLNISAIAKAAASAFNKGMNDAWQTGRRGAADIDLVYGEKIVDKDWANVFGQLHGMMKAPIKRAEFTLSLEKRMKHAMANGVDITDPAVQMRLSVEALNDGYRSIFMHRGLASDAFNTMVGYLEKNKRFPVQGEIAARTARFLFPVVRVPLNIVSETMTGVHGLATASARTLFHAINGTLDTLPPEIADSIMRQFKKGSIGAGLVAIGYLNAGNIGGYDWRQKRKEGDVKVAQFRIGGVDIPRWMTHAPWFELMSFGATMKRTMDHHVAKGKEQPTVGDGLWMAGLGLLEETPFIGQMADVEKMFTAPGRTQYLGEMAKGTLVPQAVAWSAAQLDKPTPFSPLTPPTQRKPTTIPQHVMTGIPGLRQQVPIKEEKPFKFKF